jgi:hypothetical protein
MRCALLILVAALGACDSSPNRSRSASVTVTLPPPQSAPAPGFSSDVARRD